MNTPKPMSAKPAASRRYPLILLGALIGLAIALAATALLPLENESAYVLAYPAVFVIAAASIGTIFRVFVRRA